MIPSGNSRDPMSVSARISARCDGVEARQAVAVEVGVETAERRLSFKSR